jgi:FkbM family methyltransferase
MANIKFCVLKHDNMHLFANADDNFIKTLPIGNRNLSVYDQDFEVKNIQHCHLNFLSNIIADLYDNDCTIIDVGAYVGTVSLLLDLHMLKNDIKLDYHLFEANEKHVQCLTKSIAFNNLQDSVHLYPYAVSSSCGVAKFSCVENKDISGRIDYRGDIEIPTVTIDSKINSIDKNYIIKIDTEGHEPHVISGAMNLLNTNNCILILEIHPYVLDTKVNDNETMFEYLISNYTMFNIQNIGWPSDFTKIHNKEELIQVCKRDGFSLTDIICFNKSVSIDSNALKNML